MKQLTLGEQIKELDDLMFCLTYQKDINRAIELRDNLEQDLNTFIRHF